MYNKKLSIIIPSLRKDMLRRCIETIEKNTFGLDYEIIIISPHSVIQDLNHNFRWVEDVKIAGENYAVNRGYEIAEGDYISVLADESLVQEHCFDNAIKFADNQAENVLISLTTVPPSKYEYYGLIFAPWPIIRRNLIEKKLGCLFDENYKAFYADPDLSLRVYEIGGNVKFCPMAEIQCPTYIDEVHLGNISKYRDRDREYFIKRWEHLGKYCDPS